MNTNEISIGQILKNILVMLVIVGLLLLVSRSRLIVNLSPDELPENQVVNTIPAGGSTQVEILESYLNDQLTSFMEGSGSARLDLRDEMGVLYIQIGNAEIVAGEFIVSLDGVSFELVDLSEGENGTAQEWLGNLTEVITGAYDGELELIQISDGTIIGYYR